MNHFEWNWVQEGLKFYAHGWNPPQTKAVVCFVHGFNEHSGRDEQLAIRLCDAGYAFLTYDQFGHGKTEGKRGHTPGYEAMLDSIKIILDEARTRFPNIPVYLMGHSMGGAEVVNFLLRRAPDVKGAVVLSPLFRIAFDPPAIKVFMGRLMKNIYPGFTEKANLDSNAISRDKEEVRRYDADPYNHNRITAALFFGTRDAGKWALAHAAELKTPTLLMHGTADRLTSFEASKEFVSKAPPHLVTFKSWEGFYHELPHEPEPDRTEVTNFIIRWLNEH